MVSGRCSVHLKGNDATDQRIERYGGGFRGSRWRSGVRSWVRRQHLVIKEKVEGDVESRN